MANKSRTNRRSSRSRTRNVRRRAAGTRGIGSTRGALKKSSGRPGGGTGRRERAGGSGVYPASGPMPPGNAPIKTMASWGQGDRGAKGYSDSGTSELYVMPSNLATRKRIGGSASAGRRGARSSKRAKRG